MSLSSRLSAAASAALAGALVLTLAACSGAADAATVDADGTTTIRYDGSAGQVTLPELADDLGYFEKVRLEWVGNSTGGPQSIQSAATGATDVGGAFNGAIVKLRSSGAKVTSVISYYGSDTKAFGGFYTLEDSPVTEARDLIGKKIGINTLGAQSEFVIREWLAREGLDADEIAQVELTVVPPVNAEQVLREGQVDVVAISSVFQDKALERGGLRLLFSEVELFGEFSYGSYIFRDDFIEENPEAVADYVQGIARAIRWTQVTPVDEVHARYTQIITERDRGETPELVPFWKSVGVSTPGGVIEEREISTWIDWLVRNGELEKGRFSADDIYTNEHNPYANGTYEPGSGPDGEPVDAS
ncbi:ABC transporter substrate-binding protein [Cellulomonas cellasea]|uniref:ABC transporter substrate-binding protein n=2 Tax=Cellulomonas cellasea TaxID=43670 RepID=A0A0A0B900_9CELL|nr:ABC transporter substrate-binding protein [Cellulomonas cellasea]KGM02632.1 ABC transporter substrate-binding protein [Cellulomonas cellasea DSM 20118]GEA88338.1 ABC transporter substrate-binding protein [Cellulomonas cellasea]